MGGRGQGAKQGGFPPWLWYGGLGIYLLIPVVLLWLGSLFESDSIVFWGWILLFIFALSGEIFFRVVVTLPLVQAIFVLRRRDLTLAQRAFPAAVDVLATLFWWAHLLTEPFPFE